MVEFCEVSLSLRICTDAELYRAAVLVLLCTATLRGSSSIVGLLNAEKVLSSLHCLQQRMI